MAISERIGDLVDSKTEEVHRPGDQELHRRTSFERRRPADRRRYPGRRSSSPPRKRPRAKCSFLAQRIAHAAVGEQQPHQGCVERDDDRDAAQPRNGLAVNLARRDGVVESAESMSESSHQRRQDRRTEHGQNESYDSGTHEDWSRSRHGLSRCTRDDEPFRPIVEYLTRYPPSPVALLSRSKDVRRARRRTRVATLLLSILLSLLESFRASWSFRNSSRTPALPKTRILRFDVV